ncbi:hypothetical protein BGX31_004365, partial [Mortierella sp. GBA43]
LYKGVFISYPQSINVETAIEIIVTIASPMFDNDNARSAELGVGDAPWGSKIVPQVLEVRFKIAGPSSFMPL